MFNWLKSIIAAARRLRLAELRRDYPYIQRCECGNPAYQRNGKTYKLCAECGYRVLVELLNYPTESDAQEAADKALDYLPYEEWNK